MSDLRQRLEQAVAALEAQRETLGADLLALALAPLLDKLAALQGEAGSQQLRLVTVLFTDIVGSTALSQHLDPEEIGAVMDGALERFTAIIQQHQGRVLQYAGDSLLAVFGAPVAHENDAERAVLAGLAILEAGRTVAQDVLSRHGHADFSLRVGVDTGQVLLGGGVDRDDSIRGMTVNMAARMEQTAPPGAMRISQDTYRQVRGRFSLLEQPPLLVKGHDEPIHSYLVQGVQLAPGSVAERGVEGLQTRMVGRQAQLEQLQQTFAQLCSAQQPGLQCLAVIGEAGMGKSRLLMEFRRWVDSQPQPGRWLQARGAEQSMGRPYYMLRLLLCGEMGLQGGDRDALAGDRWLQATAPLLGNRADAAVLGHLLGFDFSAHDELRALLGQARQLRDRAFFHAGQLLRAMAGPGKPMVALLDDLHWADDGTLDFLDYLAASHPDLPLLLLTLARHLLQERRPGWDQSTPGLRRLDLLPLGASAANELADALLARLGEVPRALRELIADSAEGNPFYMEELVNMLLDQGVIVADAGGWHYRPERMQSFMLPSTLVGVLQARLDALPSIEHRTAQLAAVVGFRFWDDSLAALRAPMPDGLQGLLERELTLPQHPSSLHGMREFAFKHHTLHQVAYDSVLKRVKRATHAQVARWLVSLPGTTPPELVAEHSERGGETALALDMWQRAAEAAASRYANAQALAHADRALALAAPEDWPRRHDLCLLRCRVLEVMSERDRLSQELDALLALTERLGDAGKRCEALRRSARNLYDQGEVDAALAIAQQAVAQATLAAPDRAPYTRALVGQCLLRLGRHAEAKLESTEALALAQAVGDKVTEGLILNDLGMLAADQGDPGAAMLLYQQALALHREGGNRVSEGGTLSNLGYAALTLGDYAAASTQFAEARALFAHIGHRQNEAITLINLGMALLHQAQPDQALAHAAQATSMLHAARDRWAQGAALRVMGQAALVLGDAVSASRDFEASRALFDGMNMPHLAIEAIAGLAELALSVGDQAAALSHVDAILAMLAAGTSLEGAEEPMRVHLNCHRVLAASGDLRAQPVLEQAYQDLSNRALRISDAQRRSSFLLAVPHHRALVLAWQTSTGQAGGI